MMQVLKQRFARRVLTELRRRRRPEQARLWEEALAAGHVWQARFSDFVVRNAVKKREKLRYIHRNPVRRGLVLEPGQCKWSSFRSYAYGEGGPVLVNEQKAVELKFCSRRTFATQAGEIPSL